VIAQEAKSKSSATGSLDSPESGTCEHIQKVYQDLHGSCDNQEQIHLDSSLLSTLPFPQSIQRFVGRLREALLNAAGVASHSCVRNSIIEPAIYGLCQSVHVAVIRVR